MSSPTSTTSNDVTEQVSASDEPTTDVTESAPESAPEATGAADPQAPEQAFDSAVTDAPVTDTTGSDITVTDGPEQPADDSTATAAADSDDDETTASTDGEVSGEETGSARPGRRPGDRSGRVAELEREGEIAADFLETLLDIADLDGDLEVDVEGDRAAVAIVDSEEGGVPRTLVGAGAVVLEALQELTRLAVQAETGERSRLMLDVGGYRADRRSTLVELAQRVIGEVKESGERRELEPMSAFERKIVHDQVLAAGLVSESEGEEPQRFVVVLPA